MYHLVLNISHSTQVKLPQHCTKVLYLELNYFQSLSTTVLFSILQTFFGLYSQIGQPKVIKRLTLPHQYTKVLYLELNYLESLSTKVLFRILQTFFLVKLDKDKSYDNFLRVH
jgi:hypothetical protein